jgi:hypothetical protein
MATYTVTQDGSFYAVRLGDASGPVVATFSNSMAAEKFAAKRREKDEADQATTSTLIARTTQ